MEVNYTLYSHVESQSKHSKIEVQFLKPYINGLKEGCHSLKEVTPVTCRTLTVVRGATLFLQKERVNLGVQISQWIRLVGDQINHGFYYVIYGRTYQA